MSLMDILSSYANRPTSTEQDFEEVAPQLSPQVLGDGIAHAFRSDQTPAFGDMVGNMFGGSNPALRANLLNMLMGSVGPAILGKLGSMLSGQGGSAPTQFNESDAARISPTQVSEIVEHAGKADPTLMDKIGSFYAEHPEAVKFLGGAALAIALGRVANRNQK